MQELLPNDSNIDIQSLLISTSTIISECVTIDSAVHVRGTDPILILGTVNSIYAPEATVVIGVSGHITNHVVAKKLILFGKVAPEQQNGTALKRSRIECEEVVSASGSVISQCDVSYREMCTMTTALMKNVLLDLMEPAKCTPS